MDHVPVTREEINELNAAHDFFQISKIKMQNYHYVDIRKFGHDYIDLNTHTATLRNGFMATIFGVSIIVDRTVPLEHFILEMKDGEERVYCRKGKITEITDKSMTCNNPICIVSHIMET